MSDIYVFDARSPEETARRAAEFLHRCDIILAQVFMKSYDVRQAFAAWLTPLLYESMNPTYLLHEHPLFIVAEYLGMDTSTIEGGGPLAVEYAKLALKLRW